MGINQQLLPPVWPFRSWCHRSLRSMFLLCENLGKSYFESRPSLLSAYAWNESFHQGLSSVKLSRLADPNNGTRANDERIRRIWPLLWGFVCFEDECYSVITSQFDVTFIGTHDDRSVQLCFCVNGIGPFVSSVRGRVIEVGYVRWCVCFRLNLFGHFLDIIINFLVYQPLPYEFPLLIYCRGSLT